MLFNKSILAVAVMALANVAAAASNNVQTPACVLKIIGGTDNPADSKAICGTDASKIQSQISKNCADSDASLKFFANNCAQLGHKVEVSSATEKSTATGTSGAATSSGFVTAASSGLSATQTGSSAQATGTSGSASGSGSAGSHTGTGSASGSASSPTSTFNAASSDRQFGVTTLFAAVFMGAAALL